MALSLNLDDSSSLEEFGIKDKYLSFSKERNIDIKRYIARVSSLGIISFIVAILYIYLAHSYSNEVFHFQRVSLNIVLYLGIFLFVYPHAILIIKRGIDGGYSIKYLLFAIGGLLIFNVILLISSNAHILLYLLGIFFGFLILRIVYHPSVLGRDENPMTAGENKSTNFLIGVSLLPLIFVYGLGAFFGLIFIIAGSTGQNNGSGVLLIPYVLFHIICLSLIFHRISLIIKVGKRKEASPLIVYEKDTVDSALIKTLNSIDVSYISEVFFRENGGRSYSIKIDSIKKIAALILKNSGKSTFVANELNKEKDFLLKYYKSNLPKKDYEMIVEHLSQWVELGGTLEIVKK